MPVFYLSSIRTRLTILILIVILPGFALVVYRGVEGRREAATQARLDALRTATLAATRQEQLVESARELLFSMAQLPPVRELNIEASTQLFTALLERYPRYVHIGMARPDGTFLASGLPRPARPTGTVADRAWFQRALKVGGFSIGDYQLDRFTGKPVVAFGYPVLDSKSQTIAVLGVALDLAWLNQFVNESELPPGSLLMAVDSRGTVLAHSLDPDRWVGKQFLHASPSQPSPEEERQYSVVESTGMDGVRRLYSFVRLPGPEGEPTAFVSLGISSSVVNRNADRKLWRDLLWLGLAAACTLVAAAVGSRALILNAVSALVGAASRMTAGDLSSRSGLKYESGEIGKLATP
jgi:hypothetical protein